MAPISDRVRAVSPSATLEMSKIVARLRKTGTHVHDLGLGEADYPAPRAAREALAEAAKHGMSYYTDAQGLPDLRRAATRWLNRMCYHQTTGADYLPCYGPDDVVVGVGSKQLQYASVLSLCNPGDEVIIMSPHWVSYPDVVHMAGATPVIVPSSADEGFVPPIERIAGAITERTRLIFLNSPNNPTGRIWPRENVHALCDLVLSHDDLYLLSDEIYGEVVFGVAMHVSPITHSERMRRRTILTTGLSKAWSMGGWRVGFAAIADAALLSAVRKVNSATVSSAPSMTQEAAVQALEARGRVSEMRLDFERRAALVAQRLNEMGLPTLAPQGTFYAFADVTSLYGINVGGRALQSCDDVALAMLTDARVATVAGSVFGQDDFVRLAFVHALPELEAACDALEAFVLRHRDARPAARSAKSAKTAARA